MSGPIRRRDPSRLISCGSFFLFDVATGLTLGPDPKELASSLDFLSVHLYPEDGKVETSIMLLKSLVAAGKPVLIQEMFPLHCSMPTFRSFLEQTHGLAAGWISFYWGTMPPELRRSGLISDALLASWLDFVLEEGPRYRAPARP
jgi:hypothetical protein